MTRDNELKAIESFDEAELKEAMRLPRKLGGNAKAFKGEAFTVQVCENPEDAKGANEYKLSAWAKRRKRWRDVKKNVKS